MGFERKRQILKQENPTHGYESLKKKVRAREQNKHRNQEDLEICIKSVCFEAFFPFGLFVVLRIEPRLLHMLGKCFITELYPHLRENTKYQPRKSDQHQWIREDKAWETGARNSESSAVFMNSWIKSTQALSSLL